MGFLGKIRFAGFLYGIANQALLFGVTHAQGFRIENPILANSFTEVIQAITRFATLVVIPISVIVILYAALLFMFSGGDAEKVTKARKALTWALVGIAIVLIGEGFIAIIRSVLEGSTTGTSGTIPSGDDTVLPDF